MPAFRLWLLPAPPPHASGPRRVRAALLQPPTHLSPTPRHETQTASGATPQCAPRTTSRPRDVATAILHTGRPARAAPPRHDQTPGAAAVNEPARLRGSPRRP